MGTVHMYSEHHGESVLRNARSTEPERRDFSTYRHLRHFDHNKIVDTDRPSEVFFKKKSRQLLAAHSIAAWLAQLSNSVGPGMKRRVKPGEAGFAFPYN